MPTGVLFSVFMLIMGVLGFALIGYALSYLADGKRFGEQLPAKKKVIVALAFAQWPYMFLALYGLVAVVRHCV